MRIVQVSIGTGPPLMSDRGGAIQRRVRELSAELAQRGHEVSVFAPGEANGSKSIDGFELRSVARRSSGVFERLAFQVRVARAIRRMAEPPDLVHVHSEPELGSLLPSSSARFLSYDNYFFRGGRAHPVGRFSGAALKRFDRLLPCSDYCREASVAYWGLHGASVAVLPNGVQQREFFGDAAAGAGERARLGLDGPSVLYLGRINAQKGSDLLADVAPRIAAESGARVVMAGPLEQFSLAAGERAEAEARWLPRLKAAGVQYLGAVEDSRLRGLLNCADVVVLPTVELEMFGMAAIEAEACGTPVVATEHGGLPETVPPSAGLRVPPGDGDALADAIIDLLGDADRLASLQRGAFENAERYSWERVTDSLEAIHADYLASGGARR